MNKRIIYGVSGAMVVAALLAVPTAMVSAVEATTSVPTETTSTATTDTTDQATAQARTKRAQERIAQLKTKLTAIEAAKLKLKCAASQSKLKSLSVRINVIQTNRSQVYDATIARLSLMAERLKKLGVDSSQMQSHIDKLKELISTYKADLETYSIAVSDASALDCATDPTAFKAALEQARTAQAGVYKDVTAIRTYVQNDIKTYVGGLKSQIKTTEGRS